MRRIRLSAGVSGTSARVPGRGRDEATAAGPCAGGRGGGGGRLLVGPVVRRGGGGRPPGGRRSRRTGARGRRGPADRDRSRHRRDPGPAVQRHAAAIAERYGYVEEEFFLDGEATAYQPEGAGRGRALDGHAAGTAPYRTRVIVRRPADADDFDGTVFVEWLNVTAGVDGDPDFGLAHAELLGTGPPTSACPRSR